MPLPVNAILWGIGIVVAVGTVVYQLLNTPNLNSPYGYEPPRPALSIEASRSRPNTQSRRRKFSHQTDSCSICLEQFIHSPRLARNLCCGHKFHDHCITMWLQQEKICPLCRTSII